MEDETWKDWSADDVKTLLDNLREYFYSSDENYFLVGVEGILMARRFLEFETRDEVTDVNITKRENVRHVNITKRENVTDTDVAAQVLKSIGEIAQYYNYIGFKDELNLLPKQVEKIQKILDLDLLGDDLS